MTDTFEIEVELELPPDFRPLTVGISLDEARSKLVAELDEQAVEVPPAAVNAMAEEYTAASQWLARSGVFYGATCLGLLDGELTLATLTLARTQLDCKDLDTAIDGIVELLSGANPERRSAKRYELPCGPAAVAVEATVEMVLPAAEAGTEEDVPVPSASLEAWIPVPASVDPTQRSVIVLRFSTPSVQHWEAYCPVLVEALQTLRFPAAGGGDTVTDPFTPRAAAPDADPFAETGTGIDTGAAPASPSSTNRITSALG